MRFFNLLLVACVLLVISISPAGACINDRETAKGEMEFKSRYLDPSEGLSSSQWRAGDIMLWGGLAVGAVLLLGTVSLCVSFSKLR
jgi:hypothetical protein